MNAMSLTNRSASLWASLYKTQIKSDESISFVRKMLKLAGEQHKFSLYFHGKKNYGFKFYHKPKSTYGYSYGEFKFDLNFYRSRYNRRIICHTHKNNIGLKEKKWSKYHTHIYEHQNTGNNYDCDTYNNKRISVCLGAYSDQITSFQRICDFDYCIELVKMCLDNSKITDGVNVFHLLNSQLKQKITFCYDCGMYHAPDNSRFPCNCD